MSGWRSGEAIHLITDTDVYSVTIACQGGNYSKDSEIWLVTLINVTTDEATEISVSITNTLLGGLSFEHEKRRHEPYTEGNRAFDIARYVVYQWTVKRNRQANFELGSTNKSEFFLEKKYKDDELDYMILSKVFLFFKHLPTAELDAKDLLLSIVHKESLIRKRIEY